MSISNTTALDSSPLRRNALDIVDAGLSAIEVRAVMRNSIVCTDGTLTVGEKKINLALFERVFVVGVGKCALEAAVALEECLGDRITDGIVLDVRGEGGGTLSRIRAFKGTHPFPSDENTLATKHIITLLEGMTKDDLVLVIVSGGGSTLLCQPKNMTCTDEERILQCLFEGGATIQEINTIRKHLSLARGGFLAQYAYPARVVSLIFSDVPGNSLEFIASGPTIPDTTTIEDAWAIVEKYGVGARCALARENLIETPKEKKYFADVENILIVSNETALRAMERKARECGFTARICSACLVGEAREMGEMIAESLAKELPDTVLLYGGETTVTVRGNGTGGRSQELVLGALGSLRPGFLLAALASDGRDNTDHAGAIGDMETLAKAKAQGLDAKEYLERNDSYVFWAKVGDYIKTDYNGSNVADLVIAIRQ